LLLPCVPSIMEPPNFSWLLYELSERQLELAMLVVLWQSIRFHPGGDGLLLRDFPLRNSTNLS